VTPEPVTPEPVAPKPVALELVTRAAGVPVTPELAGPYWAATLGAPFRRTYFWIFPVAVFGSSLTKVTPLGALK